MSVTCLSLDCNVKPPDSFVKRPDVTGSAPDPASEGARLREARKTARWHVNQVAERLGVSKQTVHAWEKGVGLSAERIAQLDELYSVPAGAEVFVRDGRLAQIRAMRAWLESEERRLLGGDLGAGLVAYHESEPGIPRLAPEMLQDVRSDDDPGGPNPPSAASGDE